MRSCYAKRLMSKAHSLLYGNLYFSFYFFLSFVLMKIHFYKYHGTGNDFILIDNRENYFDKTNNNFITTLCDRHFGIGADGLILLENSKEHDFSMQYYNADGLEGSMCGNGGRCIVSFAKELGIIKYKTSFETIDGVHEATIKNDVVSLQMNDVEKIEKHETHCFLNTGSPHHVTLVEGIESYPVFDKGREIRYAAPYYDVGTNVNFVEKIKKNIFKIRTYERGVENETLSCGTGVTAVAIAMYEQGKTNNKKVVLQTLGGRLKVSFKKTDDKYHNIVLKGPVKLVFKGEHR